MLIGLDQLSTQWDKWAHRSTLESNLVNAFTGVFVATLANAVNLSGE